MAALSAKTDTISLTMNVLSRLSALLDKSAIPKQMTVSPVLKDAWFAILMIHVPRAIKPKIISKLMALASNVN